VRPTISDTACQHCCKLYNRTVWTMRYAAVLLGLEAQHKPLVLPLQKHNGIFQQHDVNFNLFCTRQTPRQRPFIQQPMMCEVQVLQIEHKHSKIQCRTHQQIIINQSHNDLEFFKATIHSICFHGLFHHSPHNCYQLHQPVFFLFLFSTLCIVSGLAIQDNNLNNFNVM